MLTSELGRKGETFLIPVTWQDYAYQTCIFRLLWLHIAPAFPLSLLLHSRGCLGLFRKPYSNAHAPFS